jgi:hypothetical protein
VLGCCGEKVEWAAEQANWAEEKEGRRQTSALRAAREGKAEGKEKRGLTILKRAQAK